MVSQSYSETVFKSPQQLLLHKKSHCLDKLSKCLESFRVIITRQGQEGSYFNLKKTTLSFVRSIYQVCCKQIQMPSYHTCMKEVTVNGVISSMLYKNPAQLNQSHVLCIQTCTKYSVLKRIVPGPIRKEHCAREHCATPLPPDPPPHWACSVLQWT